MEHLVVLVQLAGLKKEDGRFDKVMKVLNKVKTDLNKESKRDLEKKDECDTIVTEKTAEAQTSANEIDEKSRFINRTEFQIVDLKGVVNKTIEEVEDLEWELHDATNEREATNEAYEKEKLSYQAAIEFIKKATKQLQKFYEDNGLALIQKPSQKSKASASKNKVQAPAHSTSKLPHRASLVAHKRVQLKKQAPAEFDARDMVVEAGKAPPPPPPTVTKAYTGHGGNKNIQGIMEEIEADVQADLDQLTADEEESLAAFEQTKSDFESQIESKMKFKADKEKEIAGKLDELSTANEAKLGEKDTLDAVVGSIKAVEGECDYVRTNFQTRIDNRKVEAEGANEAIKALGGDEKEVEYKEASEE